MAVTKTDEGTLIPEDSFAIVIGADGQMDTVVPAVGENDPISNGHILIIGLARKLQETEWASKLIEDTTGMLTQMHELAKSLEQEQA